MHLRALFAVGVSIFLLLGARVGAGAPTMASTRFHKGPGSAETIFTLSSDRFYEGAGTAKTLLTISGDRVYDGPGTAKTLRPGSCGR